MTGGGNDTRRRETEMTKTEVYNLIKAMEICTYRERDLAEEYIKLNPQDEERRNRDADLVILGIMSMYHEIKRQLGIE